MADHPILFSGPMVRALLAGTKTQTRRVVKGVGPAHAQAISFADGAWQYADNNGWHDARQPRCPYGAPGDRLWVRETFGVQPDCEVGYRKWTSLKLTPPQRERPVIHFAADDNPCRWVAGWRPSIHMPRWASRITLELTGVRIERLQEISEADAKAEGCIAPMYASEDADPSFAVAYRHLWEAINGADTWDANPYVWCLDFRRV